MTLVFKANLDMVKTYPDVRNEVSISKHSKLKPEQRESCQNITFSHMRVVKELLQLFGNTFCISSQTINVGKRIEVLTLNNYWILELLLVIG